MLYISCNFRYYLVIVFVGRKPPNKTSYYTKEESYELVDIGKEPYVAARLTKFPKDGFFTIGDGTETSLENKRKRRSNTKKYVNQPLNPSHDYAWFQRTCVSKVSHCYVSFEGICILSGQTSWYKRLLAFSLPSFEKLFYFVR